MAKKEKMTELLNPNIHERVYISNEIFQDFKESSQITSKNIAFLYTYYCLITYLYRYCKYGQGQFINNEDLKELLGYARKYSGVDNLIKKGGVIDQLKYTQTIRDFPVNYIFDAEYKTVEFEMYSDLDLETKKILNMGSNFSIKRPVKALTETGSREFGTYNDQSNTHLFDINLYIEMIDQGLEVDDFFIYQYLRYKNFMFPTGYNIGSKQFRDEIKISERKIYDCLSRLEKGKYISVYRYDNHGVKTNSNTYRIL